MAPNWPQPGSVDPLSVEDATALLADLRSPWWIAGGWAIDRFLGRTTRNHFDLDVAVPRATIGVVAAHLVGWELRGVWSTPGGPDLRPIERDVPFEVHGVLARPHQRGPWRLELLLHEADLGRDRWQFRYGTTLELPLDAIWMRDAANVPILRPEIALLHKAPRRRPVDEADFLAALPSMTESARATLATWLEDLWPNHPWTHRLG